MTKILKKHGFSLRVERLFTVATTDAFDLIHFEERDATDSEPLATFEAPENWGSESIAMLAGEAACPSIPAYTRSIEENTVPSWLWRRSAEGRLRSGEKNVKQVFHRIAGAAAYAGWKKGAFADETDARAFFDEIRYMLSQRFFAFEPRYLAARGLDWAYGIDHKNRSTPKIETGKTGIDIRNAGIDALLGGDKQARQKWHKILDAGTKSGFLDLSFADIASDWNGIAPDAAATRAALDLLAFRREDGGVDIDRLCHAVKLLTILLELQENAGAVIGLHNLAPLLMSQAMPYDSDAGRATAAALAAIVTAEACATSAQLAALLGPSLDFAANREGVLRALRNHRRAAYGDRNDYEKISVLPAPLMLDPGADLALIAFARRRWDEALELVQQHGLRFTHFSDLSAMPELAFFMESFTRGVEPIPVLTKASVTSTDDFHRAIYPSVAEALAKLGYDAATRTAIISHIAGTSTLAEAPGVNLDALRRRGFDDDTLEKVEHYLPYVNNIRLAFTPWILGEEFVRDTLKIPAAKAEDPRFDLLQHIGFSAADIQAANAFCYGRGTASGAKELRPEHIAIFATANDISAASRIRMAAAVQSFVSGNAGLHLETADAAEAERLLLAAWRQGVKSVAIQFAGTKETGQRDALAQRREKSPTVPLPEYKAPIRSALPGRRAKASGRLVGLNQAENKSAGNRKRGPGHRGGGK